MWINIYSYSSKCAYISCVSMQQGLQPRCLSAKLQGSLCWEGGGAWRTCRYIRVWRTLRCFSLAKLLQLFYSLCLLFVASVKKARDYFWLIYVICTKESIYLLAVLPSVIASNIRRVLVLMVFFEKYIHKGKFTDFWWLHWASSSYGTKGATNPTSLIYEPKVFLPSCHEVNNVCCG